MGCADEAERLVLRPLFLSSLTTEYPMSPTHRVDFDIKNRVAVIALNRAPVNAIDHPMIDAIHAALRRADADPDVGAIILTSALPGMFCGGMDLRMVAAGDTQDLRNFVYKFYLETMNIQYTLTKPTIVAINGPARGAGMTLSITSDVVLAADDIDLGYPEIDIGLIPAIHYVHLPRNISRHKAFELLFGGKPIPATEAASGDLFPLMRTAFGQRRKMLRRSLADVVAPAVFDEAGIDAARRPEELDVHEWGRLAISWRSAQ